MPPEHTNAALAGAAFTLETMSLHLSTTPQFRRPLRISCACPHDHHGPGGGYAQALPHARPWERR